MRSHSPVPLLFAVCTLASPSASAAPPTFSDPASLEAHLEEHLGADVHWVKLAELLTDTPESCVDGRTKEGVVGTPGGDAGELVLALTAIEQLRGSPLSWEELDAVIETELDGFGHLYIHTDTHALHRLAKDLAKHPTTAAYAKAVEEAGTLPPPNPAERAAVMKMLLQPEHVGCGHLRLMLEHPKAYGSRAELTRRVMEAIYERWLAKVPGVRLAVLEGGHAEKAVMVVRMHGDLAPYTRIPLVVPSSPHEQIFVAHPEVAHYLRALEARLLLERHEDLLPEGTTPEALVASIETLAERQSAETMHRLADGLPVVLLDVDGDHFTLHDAK